MHIFCLPLKYSAGFKHCLLCSEESLRSLRTSSHRCMRGRQGKLGMLQGMFFLLEPINLLSASTERLSFCNMRMLEETLSFFCVPVYLCLVCVCTYVQLHSFYLLRILLICSYTCCWPLLRIRHFSVHHWRNKYLKNCLKKWKKRKRS